MYQILLPALFGQLHDFQELKWGEDLAPNLPGESQLLLRAPLKSSELSGSFPVANCPESILKKRSVEASLAECFIIPLFLNTWKLIYFCCHPVREEQLF